MHELSPASWFAGKAGIGVGQAGVGVTLTETLTVAGITKTSGLMDTTLISKLLLGTSNTGLLIPKTLADIGGIGISPGVAGTPGTLPVFTGTGITIGDSYLSQGAGFVKFKSNNSSALFQIEANTSGQPVVAWAKGPTANLKWSLGVSAVDDDLSLWRFPDGLSTSFTLALKASFTTGAVDFYKTPTDKTYPLVSITAPFRVGTVSWLPKWGGTTSLLDSRIKDDGLWISIYGPTKVFDDFFAYSLISQPPSGVSSLLALESDVTDYNRTMFRARRPASANVSVAGTYDTWSVTRTPSEDFAFTSYARFDGDGEPVDGQPSTVPVGTDPRQMVILRRNSLHFHKPAFFDSQITGTAVMMSGDVEGTHVTGRVTVNAGYRFEGPTLIAGPSKFGNEGFVWGPGTEVDDPIVFSTTYQGVMNLACRDKLWGGLSIGLQGVANPTPATFVSLLYSDDDAGVIVPYTAWFLQNEKRKFGIAYGGDLLMTGAGNTGVEAPILPDATGGFFWLNTMAAAPTATCVPAPLRRSDTATPAAVPLLYCNADDTLYARRSGTWRRVIGGIAGGAIGATGSGTTNRLTRWLDGPAGKLTDAGIYDDGFSLLALRPVTINPTGNDTTVLKLSNPVGTPTYVNFTQDNNTTLRWIVGVTPGSVASSDSGSFVFARYDIAGANGVNVLTLGSDRLSTFQGPILNAPYDIHSGTAQSDNETTAKFFRLASGGGWLGLETVNNPNIYFLMLRYGSQDLLSLNGQGNLELTSPSVNFGGYILGKRGVSVPALADKGIMLVEQAWGIADTTNNNLSLSFPSPPQPTYSVAGWTALWRNRMFTVTNQEDILMSRAHDIEAILPGGTDRGFFYINVVDRVGGPNGIPLFRGNASVPFIFNKADRGFWGYNREVSAWQRISGDKLPADNVTGTSSSGKVPRMLGLHTLTDSNIDDSGSVVTVAVNTSITTALSVGTTMTASGKVSGAGLRDTTLVNKTLLGTGPSGDLIEKTISGLGLVSGLGTEFKLPRWKTDGISLQDSEISDNGVLLSLGRNTSITGTLTVSSTASVISSLTITKTGDPRLIIYESDALTDKKRSDWVSQGGIFYGRFNNDAATLTDNWLTVTKTGYQAATVVLKALTSVSSTTTLIGNPLRQVSLASAKIIGATSSGDLEISSLNGTLGLFTYTGAANYVARWTTTTNLGSGLIQDNNSGVGINSAPLPTALLALSKTWSTVFNGDQRNIEMFTDYSVVGSGTKMGLFLSTRTSNSTGQFQTVTGVVSDMQTVGAGNSVFGQFGFESRGSVAAGSTIGFRAGYLAGDIVGAGVINTNYGFYAPDLTAANRAAAFYSEVTYGQNTKYGLYLYGSAQNYLLGPTGIGLLKNLRNADPDVYLDVYKVASAETLRTTGLKGSTYIGTDAAGNLVTAPTPVTPDYPVTSVVLTAPSKGFTIANTGTAKASIWLFTLADDLGALEVITGNGYAKRGGTEVAPTWSTVAQIPYTDISGTPAPPISPSSGTNNYLARWTPNGSTLGIGLIQDNGASLSVNTPPTTDTLGRFYKVYDATFTGNTYGMVFSINRTATVAATTMINIYSGSALSQGGTLGAYIDYYTAPYFSGTAVTTNAYGFSAGLTINAGSIGTRYGVYVTAAAITAPGTILDERGIYSGINWSASYARWNLYLAGSAANYIQGSVSLGNAVDATASGTGTTLVPGKFLYAFTAADRDKFSYLSGVTTGMGLHEEGSNALLGPHGNNCLTNWKLRGGTVVETLGGAMTIHAASKMENPYQFTFGTGRLRGFVQLYNTVDVTPQSATWEFRDPSGTLILMPTNTGHNFWMPYVVFSNNGNSVSKIKVEYSLDLTVWTTVADVLPTFSGGGTWRGQSFSQATGPIKGVRFTITLVAGSSDVRLLELGWASTLAVQGMNMFGALNAKNTWGQHQTFNADVILDATRTATLLGTDPTGKIIPSTIIPVTRPVGVGTINVLPKWEATNTGVLKDSKVSEDGTRVTVTLPLLVSGYEAEALLFRVSGTQGWFGPEWNNNPNLLRLKLVGWSNNPILQVGEKGDLTVFAPATGIGGIQLGKRGVVAPTVAQLGQLVVEQSRATADTSYHDLYLGFNSLPVPPAYAVPGFPPLVYNRILSVTNHEDIVMSRGNGETILPIATDRGFFYINVVPGVPTGVPTNRGVGVIPLIYNQANDSLYSYNGSWKRLGGSSSGGSPITGTGIVPYIPVWTDTDVLASSVIQSKTARGATIGIAVVDYPDSAWKVQSTSSVLVTSGGARQATLYGQWLQLLDDDTLTLATTRTALHTVYAKTGTMVHASSANVGIANDLVWSNSGGTMASYTGFLSTVSQGTGTTVTNFRHIYLERQRFVWASGTKGVVNNRYGIIIDDFNAGNSVTLSNSYGIQIADQTNVLSTVRGLDLNIGIGASRWNIYAAGQGQNYFRGNVGIGSGKTTPAVELDVAGALALSGNAAVGGTLGVTGATTLSSTASVAGQLTTLSAHLAQSPLLGGYYQSIWRDSLWYDGAAASVVGAIVLNVSTAGLNRMCGFKIKGYWYNGNIGPFELSLGGYTYTSLGVSYWNTTSVEWSSNLPTGAASTDFNQVQFRTGTNEVAIIFGTVTTAWPWFRMVVSEIHVSHGGATTPPATSMSLTRETDLSRWPTIYRTVPLTSSFDKSLGTPNYLARWTTAEVLGIGATRDDGTSVSIGMAPIAGYTFNTSANALVEGILNVGRLLNYNTISLLRVGTYWNSGTGLSWINQGLRVNGPMIVHDQLDPTATVSAQVQFLANKQTGANGGMRVFFSGGLNEDFSVCGESTKSASFGFCRTNVAPDPDDYLWRWRWYMAGDADTTTGASFSNTSNLRLYRYQDIGDSSGASLTLDISRATGIWDFKFRPTYNGVSLLSGGGTVNVLPRWTGSNSSELADSGITDDGTTVTVNRRLRWRGASLNANLGSTDAECGWYQYTSNIDQVNWYKIATFTPSANYGTGGSKVVFEVHCGLTSSTQRCTYYVEMGDRGSSTNPMRYYVRAEGVARDVGVGLRVYSVAGGSGGSLIHNVYLYTESSWTGIYVTAKNTGYNRQEVVFFPNPIASTASPTTFNPVETLDFDTATAPLNWQAFGYQLGSTALGSIATAFTINGSLALGGSGGTISAAGTITAGSSITANGGLLVSSGNASAVHGGLILSAYTTAGSIAYIDLKSNNLYRWRFQKDTFGANESTGDAGYAGSDLILTRWTDAGQITTGGGGSAYVMKATRSTGYVRFGSSSPAAVQVDVTGAIQASLTVKGAGLIDTTLISKTFLGTDNFGQLKETIVTPGTIGAVGGSGTANYLARWTGSGTVTTLGNGVVQDNGSTVGIGGAPGTEMLGVTGNAKITGALLTTGAITVGTIASTGTVVLVPSGNTGYPGYIGFYTTPGTAADRRGYLGYKSTGNRLSLAAENGWAWEFNSQPYVGGSYVTYVAGQSANVIPKFGTSTTGVLYNSSITDPGYGVFIQSPTHITPSSSEALHLVHANTSEINLNFQKPGSPNINRWVIGASAGADGASGHPGSFRFIRYDTVTGNPYSLLYLNTGAQFMCGVDNRPYPITTGSILSDNVSQGEWFRLNNGRGWFGPEQMNNDDSLLLKLTGWGGYNIFQVTDKGSLAVFCPVEGHGGLFIGKRGVTQPVATQMGMIVVDQSSATIDPAYHLMFFSFWEMPPPPYGTVSGWVPPLYNRLFSVTNKEDILMSRAQAGEAILPDGTDRGFFYVNAVAGGSPAFKPIGTPTYRGTAAVPLILNKSDYSLYGHNGATWVKLGGTAGGANPPASGSGTAGYLAKWTDANTLGNSLIQENASVVGIGVAPTGAASSLHIYRGNSNGSNQALLIQNSKATADANTHMGIYVASTLSHASGLIQGWAIDVYSIATFSGTGATTNSSAFRAYASITNGSIDNRYGFEYVGSGVTLPGLVKYERGFVCGNLSTNPAAPSHRMGIYLGVSQGTDRWNVHAAGTADNYFNGNVGIKKLIPSVALDVFGDTNVSGLITAGGFTDATLANTTCVATDASGHLIKSNELDRTMSANVPAGAIRFDGLTGRYAESVLTGMAPIGDGDYTIAITFRCITSAISTVDNGLFSVGGTAAGATGPGEVLVYTYRNNGPYYLVIKDNVGGAGVTVSLPMTPYIGQVIQLAIVRTTTGPVGGQGLEVYVDGVKLVMTMPSNWATSMSTPGPVVRIGNYARASVASYRDCIYGMQVYNRALTVAELRDLKIRGVAAEDKNASTSELLSNGDFFSGSSGWTVTGSGFAFTSGASGAATATDVALAGSLTQVVGTIGRRFRAKVKTTISLGTYNIHFGGSSPGLVLPNGTNGVIIYDAIWQGTNTSFYCPYVGATLRATFDDISLLQIGCLVDIDCGVGYGLVLPDVQQRFPATITSSAVGYQHVRLSTAPVYAPGLANYIPKRSSDGFSLVDSALSDNGSTVLSAQSVSVTGTMTATSGVTGSTLRALALGAQNVLYSDGSGNILGRSFAAAGIITGGGTAPAGSPTTASVIPLFSGTTSIGDSALRDEVTPSSVSRALRFVGNWLKTVIIADSTIANSETGYVWSQVGAARFTAYMSGASRDMIWSYWDINGTNPVPFLTYGNTGIVNFLKTTGTAPFTVASQTLVTNLNADKWDDLEEATYSAAIKAGYSLMGGGVLSTNGTNGIKWGTRIISIGDGRGPHWSSPGFFDITMPTVDVTIPGYGGAANFSYTTAAGVINLGTWESLYYEFPPPNSANASLNNNFRIVGHTGAVSTYTVPYNWVLIARRMGAGTIQWFNKERMWSNESFNTEYVGQRVVGTPNAIAKFTSNWVVGDSGLSDSGALITSSRPLTVTGTLTATSLVDSDLGTTEVLYSSGGTIAGRTFAAAGVITGSGTVASVVNPLSNTIPMFTSGTAGATTVIGNSWLLQDDNTVASAGVLHFKPNRAFGVIAVDAAVDVSTQVGFQWAQAGLPRYTVYTDGVATRDLLWKRYDVAGNFAGIYQAHRWATGEIANYAPSQSVSAIAPPANLYQSVWRDALWYDPGVALATGAIVIRISVGAGQNRMLGIKIKGFWYGGTTGPFELLIGGYAASSFATPNWVPFWATTTIKWMGDLPTGAAASDFTKVELRVGPSGTSDTREVAIVLGTTTTQWPWFKMVISEIHSSHTYAGQLNISPKDFLGIKLEPVLATLNTNWPTISATKTFIKDFDYSSGTTNYAARWTANDVLGVGTLRDDGTGVGIGIAPASSCALYVYQMHSTAATASYGLLLRPERSSADAVNGYAYGILINPLSLGYGGAGLRQYYDIRTDPVFTNAGTMTESVFGVRSLCTLNAGTIGSRFSFYATASTGSGVANVNAEYAFFAADPSAGTGRYAFYGGTLSGTSRWNLYMAGTANNYLAGNLGIKKTVPTVELDVVGAIAATTTITAGFASLDPLGYFLVRRNVPGAAALASLSAAAGDPVSYDYVRYTTNGATHRLRWRWYMVGDASDTGITAVYTGNSNLQLHRYADSASLSNLVLEVNRGSGVMDFKYTPTVNTVSIVQGSGSINSSPPAGALWLIRNQIPMFVGSANATVSLIGNSYLSQDQHNSSSVDSLRFTGIRAFSNIIADVNGATSIAGFQWAQAGIPRFTAYVHANKDMIWNRYDDNAAFVSRILTINWTTGKVDFNYTPSVNGTDLGTGGGTGITGSGTNGNLVKWTATPTGVGNSTISDGAIANTVEIASQSVRARTLAANQVVQVSAAAGNTCNVEWDRNPGSGTGNNARWSLGMDTQAGETSAGTAGARSDTSRMRLRRHDDSGASPLDVFTVNRANGAVDFAIAPTVGGNPMATGAGVSSRSQIFTLISTVITYDSNVEAWPAIYNTFLQYQPLGLTAPVMLIDFVPTSLRLSMTQAWDTSPTPFSIGIQISTASDFLVNTREFYLDFPAGPNGVGFRTSPTIAISPALPPIAGNLYYFRWGFKAGSWANVRFVCSGITASFYAATTMTGLTHSFAAVDIQSFAQFYDYGGVTTAFIPVDPHHLLDGGPPPDYPKQLVHTVVDFKPTRYRISFNKMDVASSAGGSSVSLGFQIANNADFTGAVTKEILIQAGAGFVTGEASFGTDLNFSAATTWYVRWGIRAPTPGVDMNGMRFSAVHITLTN